ncbi:MAG: glycosyltransferase family 2 protein [Acidimicrobiia bacterium]
MTSPVSVVVTTYNRVEMLERCLRSVAAQNHSDFECIVVNDHPPTGPGVEAVVNHLADPRFLLYHNETNRGPAASRNRAIAVARFAILALLDDDDWWKPEFLATHVAAHETHPNAVLVYCGYLRDASLLGLGNKEKPATHPPSDLLSAMLSGRFTLASTSILSVKRDAVLKIGGYDETLKGLEDWDMICRLLESGPAVAVPQALAIYTEHPGFRVSKNRAEDFASIRRKWARFPQVEQFVRRQQAEMEFNSSRAAVFAEQRLAGWRHFARFVRKARYVPGALRELSVLLLLNALGPRAYSRLQSAVSRTQGS